ncbi:hypothetical protein PIB30_006996 [Stylosanthes scabra]|uniref:Cystatin domain-containing protein n=1 Tax=Stylosanthes scabra TaxID=79078 RepID=A0ABU6Z6D6_9FABA|nr:hypothetical protein [Stylosanthes scabra]
MLEIKRRGMWTIKIQIRIRMRGSITIQLYTLPIPGKSLMKNLMSIIQSVSVVRDSVFRTLVGCSIPGGIIRYDLLSESHMQLVTDLAKQAMQVYNTNNNASFEFESIVRVNSQVVAGRMFYITFTGRSAGNNASETFYGKVWKKINDLGSIVKFCEADIKQCIL